MSISRARTSVILAGKRDSRRHSTTSFSENVLVAETVVISFIILRKGEGLTSFHEDNSAHSFGEKKYNEDFRGVYFLRLREKT